MGVVLHPNPDEFCSRSGSTNRQSLFTETRNGDEQKLLVFGIWRDPEMGRFPCSGGFDYPLTPLLHGNGITGNDGKLMLFGFIVNNPNKSYFHQASSYYTILFLAILLP